MAAFKPQPVPDPLPQPAGQKSASRDSTSAPLSFDIQESSFQPEGGRFKQFYRNNKWYFWAIILGIAIISTLAYFAFREQTPEPTENANVEVNIDAPQTAPSGGEVIYKIQINNNDAANLQHFADAVTS